MHFSKEVNSVDKSVLIIYSIFIIEIIGIAVPQLRVFFLKLTPFFIVITFALAIYKPFRYNKRLFIWGALMFFISITLEIIGTNTGLIFGNYHYGSTLGIKIMNVPYVTGLFWTAIILGGNSLLYLITQKATVRYILVSLLSVILDIFIEQLAGKLDYWNWMGNSVPLYNYVSWFIITLAASIVLNIAVKKYYHKNFLHFFIGQTIFIIMLDMILL